MDQALVDESLVALGVTNPAAQVPGGQKYVVPADLGAERVMVKLVELTPAHRDLLLERARREVGLLGQINHPNVVKLAAGLIEIGGPPPTCVGWAEEYLEGDDLDDRLSGRWSWNEAAAMGADVARGLGALHAARIVHRDLSPRNVRACVSGRYVILDPGLARHLDRTALTGVFEPGTPGYLSPEHVIAGARPLPASDVFCAGILLYRALTDKLPIPVGNDEAQYFSNLSGMNAPSLRLLRPDLTDEQVAIVDTCLNRQSGRRYLDGSDLLSALEQL
jgi:serine/threonine protein kinase